MSTIFIKARFAALIAAFLFSWTMPGLTQSADDSPSDAEIAKMLEEVVALTEERKELPKKIEANLTLKKKHEIEFSRTNAEITNLASTEGVAIEAERPGVDNVCIGTVPEDQLAAATARCNAVLIPFNARIQALADRMKELDDQNAETTKREDERFAGGKALQERANYIENRRKQLQMSIMLAKRRSCVEKCNVGSAESAVQCLAACWDLARNDLPAVALNPAPIFKAAPNRTPEQAIEEYKNSGREKPRVPSGTTVAPPPPLSLE